MAFTSSGVKPLPEELPAPPVYWKCWDSSLASLDVTSSMVRRALGVISSVPFFLCVAATKLTTLI